MLSKNVETFIGCDKEYSEADIVLFGAPFDGTTSYRPGTRFASKAVRNESYGIETYSPYQDRDILDINVFDGGDLDLPFGNTVKVLTEIEQYVKEILSGGKLPFMIGGEHLVTLGAVKAVYEKYPDLHVIHFDAHADLREDYLGERYSHACVMRRIWDMVGNGRIHQFGIRSGDREEFAFANKHTQMHKFSLKGLKETVRNLQGKDVYFTLDLDVLDSSVFPGTGTPEAGGISFNQLLDGIVLLQELNIVGCDVNELSPPYDHSGASTALTCKVIRELLLTL